MNDPNLHSFINRVEWEPEHDKPGLKRCFDEIVTGPLDGVHIERMDDGCYWMALYKDGERQIVTFGTRRNALILGRTEAE